MDFLIFMYGCMFLVGVLGNGFLGLTLCCGPGAKTRSPLFLGLILADFLVCFLSGPVTVALYMTKPWPQTWHYIALFIQSWPVSACTILMMVVSVDRYLTVKNYCPAGQVAGRRYILISIVVIIWISAGILTVVEIIAKNLWRPSLTIANLVLVYILPACAVFVCHLVVHAKLTELSLISRAKHGELPLPMPLLRRPTNVIIVAGISKTQGQGEKYLQNVMTTGESTEQSAQDIPATETVVDLPQPPTSTLKSRRKLANSLVIVSIIFSICWLPHVICQFCIELDRDIPEYVQRYSLLIGHIHSALSPILYWTMNYRWPHKSCRFRLPSLYRSASSTNEAALGPFNPRFVRPPPVRRQSSFLY